MWKADACGRRRLLQGSHTASSFDTICSYVPMPDEGTARGNVTASPCSRDLACPRFVALCVHTGERSVGMQVNLSLS
jgi:hypothetical protein